VKGLFEKHSNWGRWGKDDERGALNYITDKKRAAAARLVQTGERRFDRAPARNYSRADNPTPVTHLMVQAGATRTNRRFPMPAIISRSRRMGGQYSSRRALPCVLARQRCTTASTPRKSARTAQKNARSTSPAQASSSRGVLLDIPRLKKVDWLEPGTPISPTTSTPAEKAQHIRVEEGERAAGPHGPLDPTQVKGWMGSVSRGMPGLDASCLPWLHERRVAVARK